MKYFNELMDHIAGFLTALLSKFADFLGLIDTTGNDLDDAKDTWDSVNSKPINGEEE
jgi:hypothetical protein